jgi:hypothetical protein
MGHLLAIWYHPSAAMASKNPGPAARTRRWASLGAAPLLELATPSSEEPSVPRINEYFLNLRASYLFARSISSEARGPRVVIARVGRLKPLT